MKLTVGFTRSLLPLLVVFFLTCFFVACDVDDLFPPDGIYSVSGTVLHTNGEPLPDVSLNLTGTEIGNMVVKSDSNGKWEAVDLEGRVTIEPVLEGYFFEPDRVEVTLDDKGRSDVNFEGYPIADYEISGYVSMNRGGPPLSGVTVSGASGGSVETDAAGYFTAFHHDKEEAIHLIVEKEGYAKARIQDISVELAQELDLEVPLREVFHSDWSLVPPSVTIDGVNPYDTVKGVLELDIAVQGDRPTYVVYVYFSGLHRHPLNGFVVDTGELQAAIDTTKFPDGLHYIRVLAYDDNDNVVLKILPLNVENELEGDVLPGDLEILNLYSVTLGENLSYFAQSRKDFFAAHQLPGDPLIKDLPMDERMDLRELPGDYSLYNALLWLPVEGAHGYVVSRTIGEGEPEVISYIASDAAKLENGFHYLNDFSSKLRYEVPIFYEVVPYNAYGEGEGLERWVIPMGRFNVSLLEPQDGATEVALQPTFTWEKHESLFVGTDYEDFREGIYFDYFFSLFETTAWLVDEDWIEQVEEYTLPFLLEPGAVYTWDIYAAEAFLLYHHDVDGFSYALSVASDMGGSLNGEHIFTTTTEVD